MKYLQSLRSFAALVAGCFIAFGAPALLAQSEKPSTNYAFTVGFIDTTCPPTSVYAAYNALGGAKEIFNDPPSTHTVSPKANQAMRSAILKHAELMKIVK